MLSIEELRERSLDWMRALRDLSDPESYKVRARIVPARFFGDGRVLLFRDGIQQGYIERIPCTKEERARGFAVYLAHSFGAHESKAFRTVKAAVRFIGG
jgi:hypothetical protein